MLTAVDQRVNGTNGYSEVPLAVGAAAVEVKYTLYPAWV